MDTIVYDVVWKDSDGVKYQDTYFSERQAKLQVKSLNEEGKDAYIIEWDVS
jgi:hypothetical protein